MQTMRKRTIVLSALLILLALLAGWLVSSGVVARRLTQRSKPPFAEPVPPGKWERVDELRLKTGDGEELGAWLIHGRSDRPCVLLLHGVNSCRTAMVPLADFLAGEGFTVMAITFRAHGDSSGETNDFGYSSRHDVTAAVEALEDACPGRPIFVVGQSFGAAAALFAAGDLDGRVAGYSLESPYKDLQSATWNRLQRRLPPVFDLAAYAGLRLWSPAFLPVGVDQIAPSRHAPDIPRTVPVVVVGGTADRLCRPEETRATFNAVAGHGKLVMIEGATHSTVYERNPPEYHEALLQLLNGGAGSSPSGP